jgi:hypothetical protein
MWEGWSKPAEFHGGRGSAPGERVAQAVGRHYCPGAGSGGGPKQRQQQQQRAASDDGGGPESVVARSGRKTERAKALVQQRILPERCGAGPWLCQQFGYWQCMHIISHRSETAPFRRV